MLFVFPVRRLLCLVLALLFAAALSGCLGCGGETAAIDAPPAEVLRQRFPEHAGKVLEQEGAFKATEQGFVLEAPGGTGTWSRLEAEFPRSGEGAVRLRGAGGFEVRVREIGLQGEGSLAERAVAYRRAGGTSFWTAAAGGVEEWLHLEAGIGREGEPVAMWEVEGATVRQRGEAVEVVDAGGVVRFQVTAPMAYTVSGREVRARLTGHGGRVELWVDAGGEAVLVDPAWTTVASMSTDRRYHTATLLPSGKVLVVAGAGSGGTLASAELYDPGTNTWTPAASLTSSRCYHTATLLPLGKVLAVGGAGFGNGCIIGSPASTELFDSAANTWTPAAPPITGRTEHTATLLKNGKVLVVGGQANGVSLASAELFDPATNTWTPGGTLGIDHFNHTATLLPSGKVLVVGGQHNGGFLAVVELYDPGTNAWLPAASLPYYSSFHSATLLPNGKVLVAGGVGNRGFHASPLLYNPAINTWTPVPSLTTVRREHTATLLLSGKVLVVGGYGNTGYLASAELYDPGTNTWTPAGTLTSARERHTATLLPSDQVLVVGGEYKTGGSLASAELYAFDPPGTPCTSSATCQSGFCADGLCCDTPCTDTCVACSAAKKGVGIDGTCGQKLDGAPCSGGTCIAGGCFTEGASSSSTSGSTSTSSTSTSSTGIGGGSPDGGTAPGTGGAPASTSSTSASSTSSAPNQDTAAPATDLRLRGGACSLPPGRLPTSAAPWLCAALLLSARRRRAAP